MSDPKLLWNTDNVRDVAESVGISALNEDAVRALSQEVEFRLGQVIIEALRFMQAGKRTVLGTQDISQALKVLSVEPLYGYESTRPLRFGEASLGPGQPLFYIEDEEVDFEKLINAPLPKVPRDMTLTAHWLAVEGVQPQIPQNPTTTETSSKELLPKGPNANPALAALSGNDNVTFKPMVKHVVSKELILYFDKIRGAILDEDSDEEVIRLREAAFASVRKDPGLHQLIPYFVQFIAEKVTHSLKNIFVLRQMLDLMAAMIDNETLYIDPYVSSLIPPVLTCLIGRRLGSNDSDLQTQYQLREFAASLVGLIATKYAKSSQQLRPRLARTCLKHFLDPTKPLGTHYGAISGLIAVGGPETVRAVILPNLKSYEGILIKAQNEGGHANTVGVGMVLGALIKAIRTLNEEDTMMLTNGTSSGEDQRKQDLVDYLGEMVGSRVAALRLPALERAVLEARER